MPLFESVGRNENSYNAMIAIATTGKLYTWGWNNYGETGQGDPGYVSPGVYTYPERLDVREPTQVGTEANWVDSSSGENSTILINSDGELYGMGESDTSCATFALPIGSGSGTYGDRFYVPTRCAPGMTFKACAHNYYYTLAVGSDDLLYVWGRDYDGGMGLNTGSATYRVPTLHTELTATVKLVDCDIICSAAVTVDNRVYVWGDGWWYDYYEDGGNWDFNSYVPLEVTGLPIGAIVTSLRVNSCGVVVLLSNGEVWAAGSGDLFLDVSCGTGLSVSNPNGTQVFKQVTAFAGRNIQKIYVSNVSDFMFFTIDDAGIVYGFGDEDYMWGVDDTLYWDDGVVWTPPNRAGGTRVFSDLVINVMAAQSCYIEEPGNLMTCGYQGSVELLGNGTTYAQLPYRLDLDYTSLGVIGLIIVPPIHYGEPEPLLPVALQLDDHVPCGHWVADGFSSPIWAFTEQPDKIPTPHLPCGHWHKLTGLPPSELRLPTGPWKAAMEHYGTPYIYVYDIYLNEVVRIDTSRNPPEISDRLQICDPSIRQDLGAVHITGQYLMQDCDSGLPGGQKGSYCYDKSYQRLWYFLKDLKVAFSSPPYDCVLYEIDISDPTVHMSVVKSTRFEGLLPDVAGYVSGIAEIWSGCSNNYYTFWSVNVKGGRIIKIRNSDHALIEDHSFNYTPLDAFDTLVIRQVDVDTRENVLYWVYEDNPPGQNAWAHVIKADLNFNVLEEVYSGGTGFSSEGWNILLRISRNSKVVRIRNYHPSGTHQYVYDLDLTEELHKTGAGMDYVINILGFEDDYVHFLTHDNAVDSISFLRRMDMSTGTVVSSATIGLYTGHGYLTGYDYNYSGTAIYNTLTKRIMTFTWHNLATPGPYKPVYNRHNWGATFDADYNVLYYKEMPVTRYAYYPGGTTTPVCNPVWNFTKDQ